MDVGARLQTIRKLKGLSQRELAKRAGVTNSTISMIEKNSVSPSISSLKKVLGGIPMSLVEFFSLDLEQDSHTQVVYKADELIDISSGAVSMRLVGKAHPSRAIAFLDETYPPGSDTGEEMLNHEGEEAGVLVDGRLRVPLESAFYQAGPALVATCAAASARERFQDAGHELLALPSAEGHVDLHKLLLELAARGANEVLVEAGPRLAGAFARLGLVDEYRLFVAPKFLGSSARPLLDWPLARMADAAQLRIDDIRAVGDDWLVTARPHPRAAGTSLRGDAADDAQAAQLW